jgi:hypothetical protein
VPTCFRLSRSSVAIFEIVITTMQCSQVAVSALCTSAFDLHALPGTTGRGHRPCIDQDRQAHGSSRTTIWLMSSVCFEHPTATTGRWQISAKQHSPLPTQFAQRIAQTLIAAGAAGTLLSSACGRDVEAGIGGVVGKQFVSAVSLAGGSTHVRPQNG